MKMLALALGLLLLVVLGASGCGPQAEGEAHLAVYLSAPLSGPRSADGQDIADGAALALEDAGGQAGGAAVELVVRDDASEGGWDAATTGANARIASQDSTAIAYIGELDSGASRTSIPVTNEAGILQVSPGSGAEDLTRATPGTSQIPPLQPSGSRTFGRVIPSDRAQGEAAGSWTSDLEIASVDVLGSETEFGRSLIAGLESVPGGPAVSEGADAEATYDTQANPFSDEEPGLTPRATGPVFGSDALLDASLPSTLRILGSGCKRPSGCPPGGSREVFLTSAALDPGQLPAAAGAFLAELEAESGRKAGRYMAYGYEAMAVILDSIERADDPLDRTDVVDSFFATSERESILGTYSIDEVGNTTLSTLGAYELSGSGRPEALPEPLSLP